MSRFRCDRLGRVGKCVASVGVPPGTGLGNTGLKYEKNVSTVLE